MSKWRIRVATDGMQRLITRIGGSPSQLWAAFAGQAKWTEVAVVEAEDIKEATAEAERLTGTCIPFRIPGLPS